MNTTNLQTLALLGENLHFTYTTTPDLQTFFTPLNLENNLQQVIDDYFKDSNHTAICLLDHQTLHYIVKFDEFLILTPTKPQRNLHKATSGVVDQFQAVFKYVLENVFETEISCERVVTNQKIATTATPLLVKQMPLLFNATSSKLLYNMFNDGLKLRDYAKCASIIRVIIFANRKSNALYPTAESGKILSEKYMSVALIVIIGQLAITAGLDANQIYNICDHFLTEIEAAHEHTNSFIDRFLLDILATPEQAHQVEIGQFEQIVQTNIFTKLSTDDIAKQMHITPNQLRSIVKNDLQITPVEYINQQKIYTSYSLLRMNTKLKTYEISEMLGFYDSSHFIKEFERVSGITPREYRKLIVTDPDKEAQLVPKKPAKRGRKPKVAVVADNN
ncbi:helix-turn-helix domain-containing protein [Periweissella ghanensis]|uniref:HTH-type transcriptional activator RhaR n=1 Tax=Periweissella ghanensis TaxID=467997 RepID=A0ABN8BQZ9_9LACO|nr:helix-turn-helix domain-containing protein [Periweissella ghanensis]MCM0600309.1 helix-turn-helix domain-containing protein [Periweissella ghanensis]CAH0419221.1 HTH-type transcriptional activator RhaR [Periweissella ghanensis]